MKLLSLLLIGGAAWVAYEMGLFGGTAPAAAPAPSPGPGGIVPASSAPGTVAAAPAVVKTPLTAAQLMTWAGVTDPSKLLSGYQWNYYVTKNIPGAQVTGMPGVGSSNWTAAAYLAQRVKYGLSGVSRVSGVSRNYRRVG